MKRVAAYLVVLFLLCSAPASARPGGGETYSHDTGKTYSRDTGTRSADGTSGYRDDADGGDGAEALVFILLLCLQYPELLLVLILGGGLVGLIGYLGSDNDWDSVAQTTAAAPVPRPRPALDQIRTIDPNFSAVLFEDFVFRLYATARTFAGSAGKLDELAPYLSTAARRALTDRQKQRPVTGVVIGQMRMSRINLPGPAEESGDFTAFLKVGIQFEANYSVGSGPGSRRFVVEDWLLRREANVRTKPPGARRFPCPNCGAPWRGDAAAGTQKWSSCGAVVDNGRFDWQVEEINVRRETDRVPGLEADVPEQGTSLASIVDERFADEWQSLLGEDPVSLTRPSREDWAASTPSSMTRGAGTISIPRDR